jgi:predicted outer membrane repeat protein
MRIQLRHIAAALLLGAACLPFGPARAARATVGIGTAASCTEAALDAALAIGGEIVFNCGGPTTIALSSEKLIAKNTSIDGGNLVTLSGQGARRIFKTNSNIAFTIKNLTLADGFTTSQGGAIELGFWNTLTVIHSTFRNNQATKDTQACDGGGAIFIGGGSTTTIENSTFTGNKANNGGAINNLRSRLTVLNSTFSGNQAIHTARINGFGDCGGGGAIYIDGGRPPENGGPDQIVLRGNTFTANTTNNHGGAIFAGSYTGDSVLIDRSTFSGNSVTKAASASSSGTGGAIWYGFATQSATNYGLTITNSTLANNTAISQGGGLWTDGPATLTNVTFSGNDATDASITDPDDWRRGNGGALALCCDAPISITNATFANNHAGFNGGAIAGKTITIKNTLFANNTTDWPIKIMQHCTDALTDAGRNMQYPPKNPNPNFFNETNCSASITIADPKLGALADNGGPTLTRALLAGSPARNAGAACPAADQRGIARPQGSACDIGAYEVVEQLGLNPSIAFVGGAGLTLTVTGEGFTSGSKILWNGTQRTTAFANTATLTTPVTAADLATPKTVLISVSGSTLPAQTFRVVPLAGRVYVPVAMR